MAMAIEMEMGQRFRLGRAASTSACLLDSSLASSWKRARCAGLRVGRQSLPRQDTKGKVRFWACIFVHRGALSTRLCHVTLQLLSITYYSCQPMSVAMLLRVRSASNVASNGLLYKLQLLRHDRAVMQH